uniref:hypothetical protein n=1 Tax=Parerythrobacter lutipelagi TaxID=1964208 RepID=UPI00137616A1|nr:hypothetical protein [Parerythrobacter lutipelagi]
MLLNMGAILLSAGVGIIGVAGRWPDNANKRTALTAGPLLSFFGCVLALLAFVRAGY